MKTFLDKKLKRLSRSLLELRAEKEATTPCTWKRSASEFHCEGGEWVCSKCDFDSLICILFVCEIFLISLFPAETRVFKIHPMDEDGDEKGKKVESHIGGGSTQKMAQQFNFGFVFNCKIICGRWRSFSEARFALIPLNLASFSCLFTDRENVEMANDTNIIQLRIARHAAVVGPKIEN